MGVKAKFEYVVYKADEVISAGTANEIIKKMGISPEHFRTLTTTRAFEQDKAHQNTMVAVKVPISEIENMM